MKPTPHQIIVNALQSPRDLWTVDDMATEILNAFDVFGYSVEESATSAR